VRVYGRDRRGRAGGLLALAVGTGLRVIHALMNADVTAACGPRGRHDPGRAAVRHFSGEGSVSLDRRRVPVERPRKRTADCAAEMQVPAYELFTSTEVSAGWRSSRCLPGLSTRGSPAGPEPVGERGRAGGSVDEQVGVVAPVRERDRTALADQLAAPTARAGPGRGDDRRGAFRRAPMRRGRSASAWTTPSTRSGQAPTRASRCEQSLLGLRTWRLRRRLDRGVAENELRQEQPIEGPQQVEVVEAAEQVADRDQERPHRVQPPKPTTHRTAQRFNGSARRAGLRCTSASTSAAAAALGSCSYIRLRQMLAVGGPSSISKCADTTSRAPALSAAIVRPSGSCGSSLNGAAPWQTASDSWPGGCATGDR
jgi:hypothetical protein